MNIMHLNNNYTFNLMLYIVFNVIHAYKCYILCLILGIILNIMDYIENRGLY